MTQRLRSGGEWWVLVGEGGWGMGARARAAGGGGERVCVFYTPPRGKKQLPRATTHRRAGRCSRSSRCQTGRCRRAGRAAPARAAGCCAQHAKGERVGLGRVSSERAHTAQRPRGESHAHAHTTTHKRLPSKSTRPQSAPVLTRPIARACLIQALKPDIVCAGAPRGRVRYSLSPLPRRGARTSRRERGARGRTPKAKCPELLRER